MRTLPLRHLMVTLRGCRRSKFSGMSHRVDCYLQTFRNIFVPLSSRSSGANKLYKQDIGRLFDPEDSGAKIL